MTTKLATKPPAPKTLERLARAVDRALLSALPTDRQAPPVIREAMRYCVFPGGKRFRPLLALGACEAVGAPARKALSVACAVELIHTYSLVHDDLPSMDNAWERRGRPSCHRKYGEANAVLVGDALLTLAFELIGRNGTPRAVEIFRVLGRACGTEGLIGGQALDLESGSWSAERRAERLEEVAQRKTAALMTASVVAGGLAGGATAAQLQRLRAYGRSVGLAFQLIDDIHDQEALAQALGVGAARQRARRLLAGARRQIAPFKTRALTLGQLAAWLEQTA